MTRLRAMTFVVVVAAILLASGCTGHPTEQSTGDSSASPSTSLVPELTGMPDPGTCWKVSAENPVADPSFDTSPKVSCTQEHTTQTAGAVTIPEPTVAMAKSVADDCWERVRKYMGVDLDHWVPWRALVFLPSKQQVADGAKWVRCDVGIPESTKGQQLVSVTRSMDGVALDPPADLWACTLGNPLAQRGQPWHQCGAEHGYEATGTLAVLNGLTRYPSSAQRKTQGARLCRQKLSAGQRSQGLAALATWDPPDAFADGQLVGICWAYQPDGRPLPPRR